MRANRVPRVLLAAADEPMSVTRVNGQVGSAMTVPRFKIVPRDVPAHAVARLLGVSETRFVECLPDLLARGFPGPDPTTRNYDLKAVEAWQDRRSGMSGTMATHMAKDARTVFDERLAAMRNG